MFLVIRANSTACAFPSCYKLPVMNTLGLIIYELDAICSVIARHYNVQRAIVFDSRAKGAYRHNSDVDVAVDGDVSPLQAESIAGDLEELPLPYQFDEQFSF